MGGSESQIEAALSGDLDGVGFSAAELAALRFSEAHALNRGEVPDDIYGDLRSHYDEGEIVEIVLVAGLFAYFNYVNNALRVEPTR